MYNQPPSHGKMKRYSQNVACDKFSSIKLSENSDERSTIWAWWSQNFCPSVYKKGSVQKSYQIILMIDLQIGPDEVRMPARQFIKKFSSKKLSKNSDDRSTIWAWWSENVCPSVYKKKSSVHKIYQRILMIDPQFWPYEVRMSFSQYIKELAEICDDFDND